MYFCSCQYNTVSDPQRFGNIGVKQRSWSAFFSWLCWEIAKLILKFSQNQISPESKPGKIIVEFTSYMSKSHIYLLEIPYVYFPYCIIIGNQSTITNQTLVQVHYMHMNTRIILVIIFPDILKWLLWRFTFYSVYSLIFIDSQNFRLKLESTTPIMWPNFNRGYFTEFFSRIFITFK